MYVKYIVGVIFMNFEDYALFAKNCVSENGNCISIVKSTPAWKVLPL